MYKLRFVNEYGKSYTLTQNDKLIVTLLDGFYSSNASINTNKIGVQPGERLASRSVNKRNIGIYFNILKDVIKTRKELYNIFIAGAKVTCYYENDENNVSIEGIIEDLTINPHEQSTTGQIIMVCPYPYFKNIDIIVDDISSIVSNFTFPFAIEEKGIPFSYYETFNQKVIINNGNIETGMKIELSAFGGNVVNPKIYNRLTTKFIGLGTEENPFMMLSGDVITIDTEEKKVSLYRNGENINIFNYLVKDSNWLTLFPGDNVFTYETQSGDEYLLISFIHQDQYEGV